MNERHMDRQWQPHGGFTKAHSRDILRLQRLLTYGKGFQLFFLSWNNMAYRDQLIQHLGAKADAIHTINPETTPTVVSLENRLAPASGATQLHLLFSDLWFSDAEGEDRIRALNRHREQMAAQIPVPVFFWLTEHHLKQIAKTAPDLWAWRTAVFDFCLTPQTDPVPSAPSHPLFVEFNRAEKETRKIRLSAINDFLNNPENQSRKEQCADLLLEAGRIEMASGLTKEALHRFEKALTLYELLGNQRAYAVTMGEKAKVLFQQGDVEAALTLQKKAFHLFERHGNPRDSAIALREIARILRRKGELETALTILQEILKTFETIKANRERGITLGDMAQIQFLRGEIDSALAIHKEALSIFEASGDTQSRAITLGDIARIQLSRGETEAALKTFQENLSIAETLDDPRGKAIALNDIAQIRFSRGETEAALKIWQENLSIAETLGDTRGKAITLGNIARIRRDKGDIDTALDLLEEKLRIVIATKDTVEESITLGDIARIHLFRGKLDKAQDYFKKVLSLCNQTKETEGIAHAHFHLGYIADHQSRSEDSILHYETAFRLFQKLGYPSETANSGEKLGRILQINGQPEKAASVLQISAGNFREIKDFTAAKAIDRLISESQSRHAPSVS